MAHTSSPPVARRGFLARLSQTAAALSALLVDPARLEAASLSVASPGALTRTRGSTASRARTR